jgi:hypothetical protein
MATPATRRIFPRSSRRPRSDTAVQSASFDVPAKGPNDPTGLPAHRADGAQTLIARPAPWSIAYVSRGAYTSSG